MTTPHPAGKGTDRRAYNLAAWDAGHRRIFGPKKKAEHTQTTKNHNSKKDQPK